MPTTTITDNRYNALREKLRELFELDKSDLDFGIYRIMAAKNKEVTEFLERQLKEVVRDTLVEHGAAATDGVRTELDELVERLRADGLGTAQIDDYPKVQALRDRLDSAAGGSDAELEADIYNHLLAFFSRYYDEGDFISKRRYKGDTYAIPYSGEEVVLHWANKDQYYIKSGEWHKDYRFRVGGKSVRFKLVDASQETGNNKEPDEAKRRYILCDTDPVEVSDDTLILRFQFRAPTDAERQRAADGAVAIFGGDFAKPKNPKKGDEREQFCADAEQRARAALAAMPEWAARVGALAATEGKPARTVLGRHLDHFTARNTFDYFIHKDLGGFLRREMDFYIKNEVVRLDDLETLPGDHLLRMQGRVKAIRRVASRLIDFLAALENFQKRLWLKKKFVLDTNWLVTVDRLGGGGDSGGDSVAGRPDLRDIVAANAAQWAQWEALGFKPEAEATLLEGPTWGTRAYLDANPGLVVDTALFESDFKARLLASDAVLGGAATLDEATTGVLMHGENFGALNLMQSRYREQIKCIYIDPPYNTNESDFLYRDTYRRSSWLSLVGGRIATAIQILLAREGVFLCSLDDTEPSGFRYVLANLGIVRRLGEYVWKTRNTDNRIITRFSIDHESIHVYAKEAIAGRVIDRTHYANPDDDPRGPYTTDPLTGKANAAARPNLHYTITNRETGDVYPADSDFGWITDSKGFDELLSDGRIHWPENPQTGKPRKKRFRSEMDDRAPASSLGISISQGEGNDALIALFGLKIFTFPKPPSVIGRVVDWAIAERGACLDYFAGSGTTGHAVINLNREDGGGRRFILVEMGAYFHTVLKPRIAKVLYAPDWKDGKAQTHNKGVSALVKYFALESYEDALNNLPAPDTGLLDDRPAEERDALIRYALDLEMGPHLLDLDAFRDPWSFTINAQLAGEDEIRPHRVDLVETFNYLIGLKVSAYGPMERYAAQFERAPHDDGLGRLRTVAGPGARQGLRRDPEGPYVFQRVEGTLNDANDTRVLVVWRKLSDDPEKDAAVLDAWMARHQENTKERSPYREAQITYINGPVTLPQPTAELRTVFPLEETFKAKMFEDTDGEGVA